MSFLYYESLLRAPEREFYRALRRGLSSFERQFSAPRLDQESMGRIFNMLKLDDPLVFGAESLSFSYSDASTNVNVKPVYSIKKSEFESTKEIVLKRVERIMAQTDNLPLREKETYIHDYIVKNVRYDMLKKTYSHEVTGPLCHGIGVCEGMAKTFKLLCDRAGIECLVVTGIGVPPQAATGKKSERHAWNIVFEKDVPLGVDVTFDNTLSNDIVRYDYFNVSDRIMMRDHGETDFPVPSCTAEGKDLYSETGMTFDGIAGALPAMRAALKAPHKTAFRLSNVPDPEDFRASVSSLMKEDRRFSRFSSYSFSVNMASGVVSISLDPGGRKC